MIVVAGPPGSGKSTAFPVSGFGVACFNADDRAAVLNRGYPRFVIDCIQRRQSFAIETTLRSHVTIEQARLAKAAGFAIEMRYLALASFELHLERVKARRCRRTQRL
jgi:predicted ABC-type ATPase